MGEEAQLDRHELIGRARALRDELEGWRGECAAGLEKRRMDFGEQQVKLYSDMQDLRQEVQRVKARVRAQLAAAGELQPAAQAV